MSSSSSFPQQADPAGNDCTCLNCDPDGNQKENVWWHREIVIRDPASIRGPKIRTLIHPNIGNGDSSSLECTAIENEILEQVTEVAPNSSAIIGSDGNNSPSANCGIELADESPSGELDDNGSYLLHIINIVPTIEDIINAALLPLSELQGQLFIFEAESSHDPSAKDDDGNEDFANSVGMAIKSSIIEDADRRSGTHGTNLSVPSGEAETGGEPSHALIETDASKKSETSASVTPVEKEQLSDQVELEKMARPSAHKYNQVEEFQLNQDVRSDNNDGVEDEIPFRSLLSQTRAKVAFPNETDTPDDLQDSSAKYVQLGVPNAEDSTELSKSARSVRESASSSGGGSRNRISLTDAEKQERREKDAERKRVSRKRDRENGTVKIVGQKKPVSQMTREEHENTRTKWRVAAQIRRSRQRETMTPDAREENLRKQREQKRAKRALMTEAQKLADKQKNSKRRQEKRMKMMEEETQA